MNKARITDQVGSDIMPNIDFIGLGDLQIGQNSPLQQQQSGMGIRQLGFTSTTRSERNVPQIKPKNTNMGMLQINNSTGMQY
tara:strand:+ start:14324 stop:14569 length:246 start_codon:yes stop_codon:yes gene_type:complete